jgi:YceI-like domain.
MQEHFNENYLESDLYPKSVFKGKISDWENIDISSQPADVTIEGELTIHGVKKSIKESGRIWYNEDKISGQCKFNIAVADYNIKIPRIVRENIAKIIEVSVNVTLKRK